MTTPRSILITGLLLSLPLLGCNRGTSPAGQTPTPPATPPVTPVVAQSAAQAGEIPPAETLSGAVLETFNAGGYTYVRLKTAKGDVWVAVSEFATAVGEQLAIAVDLPMRNFHSKTLNRDFDLLYFGFAVTRNGQPIVPTGHTAGGSGVTSAPVGRIDPVPGGMTVAEIWAKRAMLAGKTVTVRGKIVKVNNTIMDRNWFHLQDGTGAADAGTNDLTATTTQTVTLGEVVTVSGVAAINKDFGAGYSYEVILENASIIP